MNTSHEIKMAETKGHAEQQLLSQRNFYYCDKIRPTFDEVNPAKSDQSLSFFSLDHPTPFFCGKLSDPMPKRTRAAPLQIQLKVKH